MAALLWGQLLWHDRVRIVPMAGWLLGAASYYVLAVVLHFAFLLVLDIPFLPRLSFALAGAMTVWKLADDLAILRLTESADSRVPQCTA